MPLLNVETKIVAFGDVSANANPKLKYVDWSRCFLTIPVNNPRSTGYELAPGEEWIAFDGTRSTSIDNTTAFALTLSTLDPSRYRITWTGGTNPVFRTDRGLSLSGIAVTITANANGTATMSIPHAGGNTFATAGVVAGDTIFLPDTTTGDSTSPFNNLNVGFWLVLQRVDNYTVVLQRPTGTLFTALGETVTPGSNAVIQAFSAAGVQTTDKVQISGGFSPATQKTFDIVTVTSTYVEIMSTTPLPEESGITPTTAGIFFYKCAKVFVHVETNQEAAVRSNGSTDDTQRISPICAGDMDKVGWYEKFGPTWSLHIINKSSSPMNATVISAE